MAPPDSPDGLPDAAALRFEPVTDRAGEFLVEESRVGADELSYVFEYEQSVGPDGCDLLRFGRSFWGEGRLWCAPAIELGAEGAADARAEDYVERVGAAMAGLGGRVAFDSAGPGAGVLLFLVPVETVRHRLGDPGRWIRSVCELVEYGP